MSKLEKIPILRARIVPAEKRTNQFLLDKDSSISLLNSENLNSLGSGSTISGIYLWVDKDEIKPKIKNLLEQKKQIDQEIFKLRKEQNSGGGKNYIDDMVELNDVNFYFKIIKNLSSNQIKGIIDEIKGNYNRCIAVITTVKDDKISIDHIS